MFCQIKMLNKYEPTYLYSSVTLYASIHFLKIALLYLILAFCLLNFFRKVTLKKKHLTVMFLFLSQNSNVNFTFT